MQIGPTTALLQAISEVAAGTVAKRAFAAAPAKAPAQAAAKAVPSAASAIPPATPPADGLAGAPATNLPRGSLLDISV